MARSAWKPGALVKATRLWKPARSRAACALSVSDGVVLEQSTTHGPPRESRSPSCVALRRLSAAAAVLGDGAMLGAGCALLA